MKSLEEIDFVIGRYLPSRVQSPTKRTACPPFSSCIDYFWNGYRGYDVGVAFADSDYRHSLRNHLNSLSLGISVCDVSSPDEYPEWMDMIEQTANECLALLDANPPGVGDDEIASPL